jgi:hypothetical protein
MPRSNGMKFSTRSGVCCRPLFARASKFNYCVLPNKKSGSSSMAERERESTVRAVRRMNAAAEPNYLDAILKGPSSHHESWRASERRSASCVYVYIRVCVCINIAYVCTVRQPVLARDDEKQNSTQTFKQTKPPK